MAGPWVIPRMMGNHCGALFAGQNAGGLGLSQDRSKPPVVLRRTAAWRRNRSRGGTHGADQGRSRAAKLSENADHAVSRIRAARGPSGALGHVFRGLIWRVRQHGQIRRERAPGLLTHHGKRVFDNPSQGRYDTYGNAANPAGCAMEMEMSHSTDYQTILKVIHSWAPAMRLMLMQDVLSSLQPQPSSSRPRRTTLHVALGLLATEDPPPSDGDIAQWLDEHRLEKYC
jgi:hypothetical protein